MRASPKCPGRIQLALFHPPLSDPQWDQLPWEIRQHTVQLLAQMLRAHCDQAADRGQAKEARDE